MTQNCGKIIRNFKYNDEHGLLKKAIAILETCKNLRLIGETGTGKSTLVYAIASELNKNVTVDNECFQLFEKGLSRDVSKFDLLASDTLKNGNSDVRLGIVIQWLKAKKAILHLTGFNYAEQSVIGLLETIADFTESIYIDELGETFTRTKDHYLIISYNPSEKAGYSGTYTDNIATIRRFEGLNVPYLSTSEEIKIMSENMPNTKEKDRYEFAKAFSELAAKSRMLYKNGELKCPITTGNLINYSKIYDKTGLSEKDILEIAATLQTEEQKPIFLNLFSNANL